MYREDCPCPKEKCERHKQCDPCRAYHAAKKQRPYCERPKRTFFGLLKKKT